MDSAVVERGEFDSEIQSKFCDLLEIFSKSIKEEEAIRNTSAFQEVQYFEHLDLEVTFHNHSLQPFERYLNIGQSARLTAFIQSLHPQSILLAKVSDIVPGKKIFTKLLQCVDGQSRFISDLDIIGIVDSESVKNASSCEDDIKVGDVVKGAVTSIDKDKKVVHLSFEEKFIREDQLKHFPLGKILNDEFDLKSRKDHEFHQIDAYRKDLESSSDFTDPHSIKRLLNQLRLPEDCQSFLCTKPPIVLCESADEMREKQSSKWSMDMVGAGVKHFREKQLKEAKRCFDQSISFYPKNVEAFVARGALYANQNKLTEAVDDFQEALQLNPNHRNAKKYIIETLSTAAHRFEKDMKWKEALSAYKDILKIDAENKLAKTQSHQLQKILIPISDKSKTVSSGKNKNLSVKSKERLNKLKSLLQAEKIESESNSSTSSSSSDTDSSDNADTWVEKPNIKGNEP